MVTITEELNPKESLRACSLMKVWNLDNPDFKLRCGQLTAKIPWPCALTIDIYTLTRVGNVHICTCDALVLFGCYHHRDMKGYTCRMLAIPLRV